MSSSSSYAERPGPGISSAAIPHTAAMSARDAGHRFGDIARACFVSEATVRTQVRSILTKLEVSSQIAAVGLAYTADWRPVQQRDVESGLRAVR